MKRAVSYKEIPIHQFLIANTDALPALVLTWVREQTSAVTHMPSRTCQMHVAKRTCNMLVPTVPNTDLVIV